MANKTLFSSLKSLFPRATARNDAGGPAYILEPKHALAQLAATLRRDGIELRIARDIGQFRDVIRSAVPEAFHHEVFRTIDEALNAPPEYPTT